MKSRYEVILTEDEWEILTGIVKRGKGPAYRIKHAHILLHADVGKEESEKSDEEIAGLLHCHIQTVFNIRKYHSDGRNHSLESASLPLKYFFSRERIDYLFSTVRGSPILQ